MLDPETNKEILVSPKQLIVMPAYELRMQQQLDMSGSQARTEVTGGAATVVTVGPNPLAGRLKFEVLSSPIARNLIQTGLASGSQSNADQYWYMGDFKRAFAWMENCSAAGDSAASASEYVMREQRLGRDLLRRLPRNGGGQGIHTSRLQNTN